MVKMKSKQVVVLGSLLVLCFGACIAEDDGASTTTADEGSAQAADTVARSAATDVVVVDRGDASADPASAISARSVAPSALAPLPPIATTSVVNARVCWPVAGLYPTGPCGSHENMNNGWGIQYLDNPTTVTYFGCEGFAHAWSRVINLSSGHQGYVRWDALHC